MRLPFLRATMMKRRRILEEGFNSAGGLMKLILLSVLVFTLAVTGLSSAQGLSHLPFLRQAVKENNRETEKSIPDLKIPVEGGAFNLRSLRLVKVSGSTKLKGEISNDTGQSWHSALFELKAYDNKGNQLKGAEQMTIFQISDLETSESTPLDDGYGVWLEGIPYDSIAKVKAVLIDGQLLPRYKFTMRKPLMKDDLTFEDEAVKIGFNIDADKISFVLQKKADSSVEVDWDKARLVDPNGEVYAVEHSDVSLSHGLSGSLYRILLPETVTAGLLAPKDPFNDERTNTTNLLHFLPSDTDAINYKGKSISLIVPVKIDGNLKRYDFDFMIEEVEIERFHLDDERYQFLFETKRPNEADIEE